MTTKRIDPTKLMEERLVSHFAPKNPVAEAYRSLRTNIQFASPDNPPKTILVTSATAGDGKTTTAANLAITLAQTGARTLLMDTDLRKSMIHKVFHLQRSPGLTDLLTGSKDMEMGIREIGDIPNLYIMPSGPVPPNPAELLGSAKMKELIEKIKTHFDIILCDSPPVIAVTDACLLAKDLDGVLLVIKIGSTPRQALGRARTLLENVNSRIIGVVANNLSIEGGYGKYGSYYAYHYYHYYAEEEKGT